MLALIILMTLTVIALGFVTNVTLETSIVGNYRLNRETLNCAEAGLEVAMMITHEEITSQLEPFSGTERTEVAPSDPDYDPNVTKYIYSFKDLFDDCNGSKVKYRVIPDNADPQKNRFVYRTYVSCSEVVHYAYPYTIEVLAEPETGGVEYLKRNIRILETPLVQYFIFFDDDLPWHSGPNMYSWGRIHTNGNIWFSPDTNTIRIKNFTDSGVLVQHFVTASGMIYHDSVLGPVPAPSRNGHVYVRVYEAGDINIDDCAYPSGGADCDYVEINVDINSTNYETTEKARFTDPSSDCTYLIVGVPKSPTLSFNALFRGSFYERKARNPDRSEYFGLAIVIEDGATGTWPPENTGDLTGTLHIYAATKDFAFDYDAWPDGVKWEDVTEQVFNAGGGDPYTYDDSDDGSIAFSPETVYNNASFEVGGVANPLPLFPPSDTNALNPVYLERNDQRQDMGGVALTVVNLKALENWFFEYYLDEQYDNDPGENDQTIEDFLYDDVTGNPTKLVIYVSRTPTVDEAPGWAGYTEDGGPPYPYYDDPSNQILQAIKLWNTDELVCPTTVVTDNPIYVEGNFNKFSAHGCAVIGDLVNLLSNNWHSQHTTHLPGGHPAYSGNTVAYSPMKNASETEYWGAFFSGRDDLANFAVRGGTYNKETEGIHNFLEFHEVWDGKTCKINGCMINLWFTRQALGLFECCGYNSTDVYQPPNRNFGWDPGYLDPSYWPPYCPSAYGVERVGWLEGETYDTEFTWDPNE